jgi:hypothetical protein
MFIDRQGTSMKKFVSSSLTQSVLRIGQSISRDSYSNDIKESSTGIKVGSITYIGDIAEYSIDKRTKYRQKSNLPVISVNQNRKNEEEDDINFNFEILKVDETVYHDKEGYFVASKYLEDVNNSDFEQFFLYENYNINREEFIDEGCDVLERLKDYPHDIKLGQSKDENSTLCINTENYENYSMEDIFIEDTQDSNLYITIPKENFLTSNRDSSVPFIENYVTGTLTGNFYEFDYNKLSRNCGLVSSPDYISSINHKRYGTESVSYRELIK